MTATRPPLYYRLATRLLAPIYRQLVIKKSKHRPTLKRELAERFGEQYSAVPTGDRGVIWCHAVSLGELNTAYPLLCKLLEAGFGLWISSTTQTGFERAAKLFADQIVAGQVAHSFVPVDTTAVVTRFLDHVRPCTVLFIETELWANTLYACKSRGIPSLMINARLSDKSYQGYAKIRAVSQSMMANLDKIIAQDVVYAKRFGELGASDDQLIVMASLKWASTAQLTDVQEQLAADITAQIHHAGRRAVWVMASTHDGEESLALDAHRLVIDKLQQLSKDKANPLLILVPRHPERFDAVADLCKQSGLITARRSAQQAISADTQVYLADSMGELLVWYKIADYAVVGGSFVPVGGHNPIEAISLGTPVIMGSFDDNCKELVKDLKKVGALAQISADGDNLAEALSEGITQAYVYHWSGEQGMKLVAQKQQTVTEQFQMILSVIDRAHDKKM